MNVIYVVEFCDEQIAAFRNEDAATSYARIVNGTDRPDAYVSKVAVVDDPRWVPVEPKD